MPSSIPFHNSKGLARIRSCVLHIQDTNRTGLRPGGFMISLREFSMLLVPGFIFKLDLNTKGEEWFKGLSWSVFCSRLQVPAARIFRGLSCQGISGSLKFRGWAMRSCRPPNFFL